MKFLWRALSGCILALLATSALAAAPTGSWWNTSFPYRYKITIPAGGSDLDAGYAVSTTFNHAAAVSAATSLASGDDVRIVRWNGSTWVELDRVSNAPETWNTASARVWFKTATAINSGASDDNYYLYYGKTTAPGTPPANGENVFTLHDEFTGTTLSATRWSTSGFGSLTVASGALTISPGRTVQSDSTFGLETIWEARALTSDTLPGGGSKFFYLWLASNSSSYNSNHVGFYADVGDYHTAGRNLGATVNDYTNSAPTSYRVYSFTREFVTFIFFPYPFSNFRIDGTLIDTISTNLFSYNLPTAALPVLIKNDANGSRTQVYDWMRVRPYRNPEPVPTEGTLEQLAGGLHHFVVTHDRYGINCLAETITVSPVNSNNTAVNTYNQQITLTAKTGKGTWSRLTGTGTLTDTTPNDGLATYQWVSGETSASFGLYYPEGTQSVEVDVCQSGSTTLCDDGTEGAIAFAPSGFTVTSSALVNGGSSITVPAFANQTAGTNFTTYIAAYGQTPTDAQCGIIEEYKGSKSLELWTGYANPTTGTVPLIVNGIATGATEGTAVTQSITFTNGQATLSTTKYKDVGNVTLNLKDDTTGNPSLPGGIRGSGALIVKPAYFGLQARRPSDSFLNPAASDANGAAFIGAGTSFNITATAYDAENSVTPNYGRESTAETVALTKTLVAPVGGNNPALVSTGFGAFSGGSATGTGFSWSEVGIIALTARIGDGSYLGAGDITGTTTNIGRFTPAYFSVTASNSPVFKLPCYGFNYIGETLEYSVAPVLTVTARNAGGTTTQNYAGSFFKLTAPTGQTSYTTNVGTLTDVGAIGVPTPQSTGPGVGQLTYPVSPATLGKAFQRTTPIAPLNPSITLSLALTDTDNVAVSPSPYTLTMTAPQQRYGRVTIRNAVSSELVPASMLMRTEFYLSDTKGFVVNANDFCSTGIDVSLTAHTGGVTAGNTCVLDVASCATTSSITSRTPLQGAFTLKLRAPGAGNRGTVTVNPTVPTWLRYDWNPATLGDENPSARATFGIYQGSPSRLYTRERY